MLRAYCGLVSFDYTEWILICHRHVAYLSRYAPGLGMNSCGVPLEQWPLSRLLAYVKMTSDIVAKENSSGSPGKIGPPG